MDRKPTKKLRLKPIIFVALVCFILFSIILIFFEKSNNFVYKNLSEKERLKVEKAIEDELQYVFKETKDIIASDLLFKYIEKRDMANLLAFLDEERKKRNLEIMVVTDKEGFVLTRVHVLAQRGDNIFLTTAHGRRMAKGEDVSIVTKGARRPLIMITGLPIIRDEKIVGGLVTGYMLSNNEYISKLKRKYLDQNIQLAFYTYEEGIVGDSFEDNEVTKLLNSHFSIGSELLANKEQELKKQVGIGGKHYFVKNVVFPGLDESPGGFLVFVPSNNIHQSIILSALIALIFLLLTIYLSRYIFNSEFKRNRIIVLGISFLIFFSATFFITLYKLNKNVTEIKESAYIIFNSTLRLEPECDIIDRLIEKRIAIKVLTGGEAINAVQVVLNYNPEIIEVLEIIKTNSFCNSEMFIEKTIDNKNGQVIIVCSLPTPGFSEPIGTVAELLLRPLQEGEFSLLFGDRTQVLANDGLGTNVLRLATNGSYRVMSPTIRLKGSMPLSIFSYSHPNNERWYKTKNLHFAWLNQEGYEYRYTLNQTPDFIPDRENVTSEMQVNFDVKKDGVYYFHLLSEKDGIVKQVSHFKVMIDSTPPLPPVVQVSDKEIDVGEMVRFDFTGKDELSGIQAGFYVKIERGIFFPVKPPLYMPFLEQGKHSVTIRAFDKAGNFSDTSVEIKVGTE